MNSETRHRAGRSDRWRNFNESFPKFNDFRNHLFFKGYVTLIVRSEDVLFLLRHLKMCLDSRRTVKTIRTKDYWMPWCHSTPGFKRSLCVFNFTHPQSHTAGMLHCGIPIQFLRLMRNMSSGRLDFDAVR